MNKAFKDMSLEELKEEERYWLGKVEGATSWGAALGQAREFLEECRHYIRLKQGS